MLKRTLIYSFGILFPLWAQAQSLAASDKDSSPPAIYNFSLPTSQQPGAFISFGQNIVDKNEAQIYIGAIQSKGQNNNAWESNISLVYGLTQNLSLTTSIPYELSAYEDDNNSAGIEDIPLQLEYVLYSQNYKNYADTITVVGNITLPTGSSYKQPATGYGSTSFFLGTTLNRSFLQWFGFTSEGSLRTTSKNGNQYGNQYLYQLGLGRNLYTAQSKWILAGIVELTGTYSEKNRFNGITDPNSGGNVIFLTPSVWISTKKLIFQIGAGDAIFQQLNGQQNKNGYILSAIVGWTL